MCKYRMNVVVAETRDQKALETEALPEAGAYTPGLLGVRRTR